MKVDAPRYLLHDRDTKFTISFRAIIKSGQSKPLPLLAHSPNLKAYLGGLLRYYHQEAEPQTDILTTRGLV
jgi:putative transposase